MENKNEKSNNSKKLMQAQTLLWSHVMKYVDSMCLKCAVELGIPQAVHLHGDPITINDLLSSLSISSSKKTHMFRLMRILSHSGIFTQVQSVEYAEEKYAFSLTPVSSLLIENNDLNLSASSLLMLHPVAVNPFHSMSAWYRSKESPTPFHTLNGCSLWEMTEMNPEFGKLFNEAMASDAKFLMDVLVKDHGKVFDGVDRLVDVGGGTGSAALAISQAFSNISCTVLDLQQVVDTVKEDDKKLVEFVAGDMFEFIPPADAIFLKWILHNWNNEECVKILKRCREAILCNANGGKVIIIDQVVGSNEKSREAELYFDMLMMVIFDGVERDEEEWSKIFTQAGFEQYRIIPAFDNRCIIELFPFNSNVNPFHSMSAWYKSKESPTSFHALNGCSFWEMTEMNPEFGKLFNEAMASDAKFLMDVLVKDHGNVFDGVDRLVDVGGGTGSAALAISQAFSNISCSVLERQQVVDAVMEDHKKLVEFVAGDMFEFIPPADAVFLKWILHDWNNAECVKILKRCREAILCNKNKGKVIIIDQVVGSNKLNEKSREAELYYDMAMMVLLDGVERDEEEWSKIFTEAEFEHYRIIPAFGNRCIIELSL